MNSRELWEVALDRWSDMYPSGYKRLLVAILAENIAYDAWIHKNDYPFFDRKDYSDTSALAMYARILGIDMVRLRECIYRSFETDLEYVND